MKASKLRRGELIAMVGGALLAAGLFLDWYSANSNHTKIKGLVGPVTVTGWEVHTILRYLLLAAAAAPFILAYIIARDHALSWPRGEMTAVVAIAAFGLVAYNAFVSKPGDPTSQVSLQLGVFVAIAGSLLMLFGSATRSSETERRRKPPGEL